jgi:type I restriction enzyme S subunit
MSFKPYSEYRDSKLGWFDSIPSHWSVEPCRSVFIERNERNDPLVNEDYLSLMANIGVLPYEEKGDVGNKKPEDLGKCKQVYIGDLVINSMNYGIGSYGLSKYRGVCSPVYIVLTPKKDKIEERFAFRILETKQFQKYAQSFGNGILEHRAAINWDILKIIGVPVPPIEEQRQILSFLDIQTTKIDGLIAEQEKLIELLKEKRQALALNALTKGLEPNVAMKDSGVEWLGRVPAHWQVGKAGFYLSILSGYAFPSSEFSEDESNHRLLRGINVGVSELKWEETVYWKRSLGDGLDTYELKEGDLVIGMDRPLIKDGIRVAKVKVTDLPCLLLQRVASISVGDRLNVDFLFELLSSNMFSAHFLPETTGVSVPHISPEQINTFVIPIPSLNEQKMIVDYVTKEKASINALLEQANTAIKLLEERRSTLISSAVAGQIDVRNAANAMEAA